MSGWVKGLLVAVGLVALIVLTVPWWLGAAARPFAAKFGATYERYERTGYRTFAVHHVKYVKGRTEVTIGRIEGITPLVWGIDRLRGYPAPLSVKDWNVRVAPNTEAATPREDSARAVQGLSSLQQKLGLLGARLATLLPVVEASNGAIEIRGQRIAVPHAVWRDGRLVAEDVDFRNLQGDVQVWAESEKMIAEVTLPSLDAAAKIEWRGDTLSGGGTFWTQPWSFSAEFPAQGWWPEQAFVRAKDWHVP